MVWEESNLNASNSKKSFSSFLISVYPIFSMLESKCRNGSDYHAQSMHFFLSDSQTFLGGLLAAETGSVLVAISLVNWKYHANSGYSVTDGDMLLTQEQLTILSVRIGSVIPFKAPWQLLLSKYFTFIC